MHIQHSVSYEPDFRFDVLPAQIDEDEPDIVHPVQITVHPFGHGDANLMGVYWSLGVDEAAALADGLARTVREARDLLGDQ